MSKARWKDTGGGIDFEPAPAGLHIARCYQIIDLGTHYNEMFGNYRRQTFIGFELPTEIRTWKDKDGNKESGPFMIGKFYTMSLNEKANLRKDLESWRGKPFTEKELEGFDPENILGVPAMINVLHESKDGKIRAKIASISRMMKGVTCPKAVNPTVFFSLDDFSKEKMEQVPDGFQKIIMKSQEWGELVQEAEDGGFVDDELPDLSQSNDGIDDLIPF